MRLMLINKGGQSTSEQKIPLPYFRVNCLKPVTQEMTEFSTRLYTISTSKNFKNQSINKTHLGNKNGTGEGGVGNTCFSLAVFWDYLMCVSTRNTLKINKYVLCIILS